MSQGGCGKFKGLVVYPAVADYLRKNQTAQFVAQTLRLLGIAGGAKAFGKPEERILFPFPRFDAEFHWCGNGSAEQYAHSDKFCRRHRILVGIDVPYMVHYSWDDQHIWLPRSRRGRS